MKLMLLLLMMMSGNGLGGGEGRVLLVLPKQTKDKSTRKFKLTKIMHEHYQKETAIGREREGGRESIRCV